MAWLGAQTIGAIASLPAYAISVTDDLDALSAETQPHPGIAQLIELAKLQSLNSSAAHRTRDFYMDGLQYR